MISVYQSLKKNYHENEHKKKLNKIGPKKRRKKIENTISVEAPTYFSDYLAFFRLFLSILSNKI